MIFLLKFNQILNKYICEDTFLGKYNKEIDKVVLKNTPKNHWMTAETFKNRKQMLQQLRLYMILLNISETHCLLS